MLKKIPSKLLLILFLLLLSHLCSAMHRMALHSNASIYYAIDRWPISIGLPFLYLKFELFINQNVDASKLFGSEMRAICSQWREAKRFYLVLMVVVLLLLYSSFRFFLVFNFIDHIVVFKMSSNFPFSLGWKGERVCRCCSKAKYFCSWFYFSILFLFLSLFSWLFGIYLRAKILCMEFMGKEMKIKAWK